MKYYVLNIKLLLNDPEIHASQYLDMTDCIGRRELVTREEMNTWDIVAFWGQNQVLLKKQDTSGESNFVEKQIRYY